ncbi:Poly(A) RNA polymerase gld-2-like protein, partial [Dinothrombium tinctorium]
MKATSRGGARSSSRCDSLPPPSPEPQRHRRKSSSPQPHAKDASDAIHDRKRKLVKKEQSSTNIDDKPGGEENVHRTNYDSKSKKFLPNPIIKLTEPSEEKDDEKYLPPPSRKRKHPSGNSDQSASNVAFKYHSPMAAGHLRPRSGSLNSICNHNQRMDILSQEIWELYLKKKQTDDLWERKTQLREIMYSVLKNHFLAIDLYIVGSSLNGLGSNSSDVDMCLVLRDNSEDMNQSHAIPILQSVRTLLKSKDFVKNTRLIVAKVPILKFTDSESGIEVDLNVNNIVGIRNTQLIRCYTRMDERVTPLTLTVKTWARFNRINDAHNKTLSSYTFTLMVIHYLQYGCEPPVLPCLHKLIPDQFVPDSDITSLNLFVKLPYYKSENTESVGQLFVGFLNYFSFKFSYKEDAVSVRVGGTIPKYIAREFKGSKNTPSQWRYICVEEPFDRTNTARSVYDEEAFNF